MKIRDGLPQQRQIIQHVLQVLPQREPGVEPQRFGKLRPVQFVPGHGDEAVQIQPRQRTLGAGTGGGSHGSRVGLIVGIMPQNKGVRVGLLDLQRCLQGAGTQCVVGIQKYDIVRVGGGKSRVAGAGNAAVLLVNDLYPGVAGGPGVAQRAAGVGAAVIHQHAADAACHPLAQDAGYAAVQRGLGPVHRHHHADSRAAHDRPPNSSTMRTKCS